MLAEPFSIVNDDFKNNRRILSAAGTLSGGTKGQ
jgi:hypothetical protein